MLTDIQVRKAKAKDKPYKLTDFGGLHLYVSAAGSKLWRFKYKFVDKEKLLSLGSYPTLSIADARKARDEAKAQLREGHDPGLIKKHKRLSWQNEADKFEAIAREWFDLMKPTWAKVHAADVIKSLETDVFPTIGSMNIRQITAPMVLTMLRGVEQRGAVETARRLRQRISAVSKYAIATGRADIDPAGALSGVMAPLIKGRQPAVTNLNEARDILARVEAEFAHPSTKLALRMLALTAVRPGVIAALPWSEIDSIDPANPIWIIPAARMKLKTKHKSDDSRDHFVPLTPQVLDIIEAIRPLTGKGPFVFPNGRTAHKPMSENAMGYLLNRAGYHHRHVPHGWRSTFSSIMNERMPADRAIIDLMLAHVPKDKIESAYNRAEHMERRRQLAAIWADLILDGRPPAAELILGRRRSPPSLVASRSSTPLLG